MGKLKLVFTPRSLTELAAIQMTRNLLSLNEVKKFAKARRKLAETSKERIFCYEQYSQPLFKDGENVIYQIVDNLNLPARVEDELIYVIQSMGGIMWDWIFWMKNYIGKRIDYDTFIDHIQFTQSGRVDDVAVIRSMFYAKVLPENKDTFVLLGEMAMQDALVELWPKVKNTKSSGMANSIFCYWASHLTISHQCGMCRGVDIINDEVMFMWSVLKGFYTASQYYWRMLNEFEKKRALIRVYVKAYQMTMDKFIFPIDTFIFYLQLLSEEKAADMLKLMLDSTPTSERLTQWPWDDLLRNSIDKSWELLELHECDHILHDIGWVMACDVSVINNFSEWLNLFRDLWMRLKPSWKQSIDLSRILDFLSWKPRIIKFLIDDPDLQESRPRSLKQLVEIKGEYKNDEREEDFLSDLNEWLTALKLKNEEREWFENEIKSLK